jgi:hypothetical protein
MARENYLYDEERPLPYLVQLVRIDGAPLRSPVVTTTNDMAPALMHLDLRGGEFSRPTSNRMAKTFDWLTRAYHIRRTEIDEHALRVTPMPPRQDEEITGGRTPYIPDDWPDLRKRSFLWVPVAFDDRDERYAWQRR